MRRFMDTLFGDRRARVIMLIALAGLAAMLYLLPTSTAQEGANNRLAGEIIAGLFVIVAILAIILEVREWPFTRANLFAARQAQAALRIRGVLPIPPLPHTLSKIQRDRQPGVENYIRQLVMVPWGKRVSVPDAQAQAQFYQTLEIVRRISGDWSKLREPLWLFASMPAPWCHIGAAEIMFPLSYHVGQVFSPLGLRQGLRFIAQAQAVDPANADALITRARLLSSLSDPRWLQMAEDTLTRAQALAPNHPRLPGVEAAYFQRLGSYEKALACYDQAIARAVSPEGQTIARTSRAHLLLEWNRYDDAVAAYYELLRTNENDPWLWHNLSIALYNLDRYEEASQCNERALSIMPFGAAYSFGETIRKKLAAQPYGPPMGGGYA